MEREGDRKAVCCVSSTHLTTQEGAGRRSEEPTKRLPA